MTAFSIKPSKTGLEVLQQLINGVHDDVPLRDFCLAQFGQLPTLYIGFDSANPPKSDVVPWIGATIDSMGVSEGYDSYIYDVSVGAAITASTKTTADASTGIISYDAVSISDEFGRLLLESVNNAMQRTDVQNNLEILSLDNVQIDVNLPHIAVFFNVRVGVDLDTNIY